MVKIFFTIAFMIFSEGLFAQYLHYWDDSKPRRRSQSTETPPVQKPITVKETPPDTFDLKMVTITPIFTSAYEIKSTQNKLATQPLFTIDSIVFHEWPDLCPGLSGSLPVLTNYVPKEIVLIINEKFKGHLYSISSYKGPDNKQQYKLKVCEEGMIKYEYADSRGNILSEND